MVVGADRWCIRQCSLLGKRQKNEDVVEGCILSENKNNVILLVACDGIGGMAGGALAAQECANWLITSLSDLVREGGRRLFYKSGASMIGECLKKIRMPSDKTLGQIGGSTATAILFCLDRFHDGYHCISAWAGDSRIWLMNHSGILECLSKDDLNYDGLLTSWYDGRLGTFAGYLHINTNTIPFEPLAFGLTTDGLHGSCTQEELCTFIAYCLLEQDSDFCSVTEDFISNNLGDNASCVFSFRRKALPKKGLMRIIGEDSDASPSGENAMEHDKYTSKHGNRKI